MNHTINRISKWILFLACITFFIVHMMTAKSVADFFSLFQYYTIQSNAIVMATLAIYLLMDYKVIPKISFMPLLMAISTGLILVTGIIFHLFLANLFHPTGLGAISNFLGHTFVPFGTLAYFIFFFNDYIPNKKDIPLFAVYPFIYALVSLVRGKITGFYPYWFINPRGSYPIGIGSYLNVSLFIVGFIFSYFLLCLILIRLNKFFSPLFP